MQTQRINVYVSGGENIEGGLPVYFIEQYNPDLNQWFNVGDVYTHYNHAEVSVDLHNIRQVHAKFEQLRTKETK